MSSSSSSPSEVGRAAALASLIVAPTEWRHRRVDSILVEGDSGRRRVSVDCTVPHDKRLLWHPATSARQQMVVPLGLFAKGALRDFDAKNGDGRPLPMLGMGDSADLAADILMFFLTEVDGVKASTVLEQTLRDVATCPAQDVPVQELLDAGTWRGERVIPQDELACVSLVSQKLLRDISEGFLVFVLVPFEESGVRQVLKLSHFWTTEHLVGWGGGVASLVRRIGDSLLASLALRPAELEFPVPALSDYASFHFELHLPSEIVCESLSLPEGARAGSLEDTSGLPVAHVHGSYEGRRTAEQMAWVAQAALGTRFRGTFAVALVAAWSCFLFFLLSQVLPGTPQALRDAEDPASLLLALPVAILGLFLGVREHPLSSFLLDPLRCMVLACAVLVFVAAASLAWGLEDPWFWVLWEISTVVTGVLSAATMVGATTRVRRSRHRSVR